MLFLLNNGIAQKLKDFVSEGGILLGTYYQAARSSFDEMTQFFETLFKEAGIEKKELPAGLEYHSRQTDKNIYEFYLNIGEEEIALENVKGINLMTGNKINHQVSLQPKDFIVTSSLT